jgi:CheY-like chemotaxis protein
MSQPRVLIVDDESHIVHVVSLKLRNNGYDVLTAQDGEEGLAIAREQQPDLLITDYQMPYMTGLELCLALQKEQPDEPIPALMLTARGFSLAKEYTDQANIVGLLSKPFSPREVLACVNETLASATPASSE